MKSLLRPLRFCPVISPLTPPVKKPIGNRPPNCILIPLIPVVNIFLFPLPQQRWIRATNQCLPPLVLTRFSIPRRFYGLGHPNELLIREALFRRSFFSQPPNRPTSPGARMIPCSYYPGPGVKIFALLSFSCSFPFVEAIDLSPPGAVVI